MRKDTGSTVRSVRYEPESGTLEIELHNGGE